MIFPLPITDLIFVHFTIAKQANKENPTAPQAPQKSLAAANLVVTVQTLPQSMHQMDSPVTFQSCFSCPGRRAACPVKDLTMSLLLIPTAAVVAFELSEVLLEQFTSLHAASAPEQPEAAGTEPERASIIPRVWGCYWDNS